MEPSFPSKDTLKSHNVRIQTSILIKSALFVSFHIINTNLVLEHFTYRAGGVGGNAHFSVGSHKTTQKKKSETKMNQRRNIDGLILLHSASQRQ